MLGWLTTLLFTLIVISTAYVRQREGFDAATPSGRAELNSVDVEYQTLLDAYGAAYIASKQPGGSSDAVTLIQSQIEAQQESLRNHITQNQFYIQTFLDEYQNTNPDLVDLHTKAQTMKAQGPGIADELVASKADTSTPVDYGGMITRVVVLVLLLGVGIAISSFA